MAVMEPQYSRNERLIDGVIHGLGVAGSTGAVAVLLAVVIRTHDAISILAAAIYGACLIAMFWLSAAYNLLAHPGWKERLRPYDHAAIFLMIAGTYTPFALVAIGGGMGCGLLALVWLLAIAGLSLKLLRPRRLERASVIMYLALGWIGLPAAGLLVASVATPVLVLLGIGGLLYTLGVVFHLWQNLAHQNAVWHGFVLAAAGCHFAAVLNVLAH
jgi:hemolysin III